MRRIGQESARMRKLVEELLLLARLDEGRPPRLGPVDITAAARDAVLDAPAPYPWRRLHFEGDGPVVVTGDPDTLSQVVRNLVANALKHTNGPVTVSVTAQPGAAELVVSDTGPGMSPDGAAHAFDRFWQADPSRAGAGSGLGLSIVAAIVAAHDGSVSINSDPAAGTRVVVALRRPAA
jgi:two-component system OmpR family sensor kinase